MDELAEVRTARLVGRRPLLRDAEELHPVLADEQVARWLWPGELGGPRTLAQTRTLLIRDADHWKRHRWGPWVVRDLATNAVVGRAGISRCEVAGREEVEVAWLLAPDRWGQGLATEIAAAAVEAAFATVGLEDLVSFTVPHNAASRGVMRHLGFEHEADVEHAGLPHVLYRLSRPAWAGRSPGS